MSKVEELEQDKEKLLVQLQQETGLKVRELPVSCHPSVVNNVICLLCLIVWLKLQHAKTIEQLDNLSV